MLQETEKNYDIAKQYFLEHPEYINIASSLAVGFLPAVYYHNKLAHDGSKYNLNPLKLGLAIAFHAAASVVTHYLEEHDYISSLTRGLLDNGFSTPIFLTSIHSYNDWIVKSQPLSTLPVISTAYKYGAGTVSKAFSFGTASLCNLVAASEIGKAVLRAVDDETAYKPDSHFSGVYLGLKYFPAMIVKYSFFPELQEGISKAWYSHHYFGAGIVQGALLKTTDQLFEPQSFEIHNYTKGVIETSLDSAINTFLYEVPGHAIGENAWYKENSIKPFSNDNKFMAYTPIAATVENINLLAKKWHGIPEATDLIMQGFESILIHSNSTLIDEL